MRERVCAVAPEFAFELADRACQAAAAGDELAGDPHLHRLLAAGEPAADPLERIARSSAPGGDREGRVELVQMPAQPLLAAAAFVDQVVAVRDQQLQLASAPLPAAADPVRLAQRCPGAASASIASDLPRAAPGAPLGRGQLRRHPHQPLARRDKLTLERAAHMAAVLDRPQALAIERSRPGEQSLLAPASVRSATAARLVDRSRRQRLLVHVHPDTIIGIASYRSG